MIRITGAAQSGGEIVQRRIRHQAFAGIERGRIQCERPRHRLRLLSLECQARGERRGHVDISIDLTFGSFGGKACGVGSLAHRPFQSPFSMTFVLLLSANVAREMDLSLRRANIELLHHDTTRIRPRSAQLCGVDFEQRGFITLDDHASDLSALEPENVKLRGAIITIDQTITIAEALGLDVRRE